MFSSIGTCILLSVITNQMGSAFGDFMFVTNIYPPGIYTSEISLNDTALDFTTVAIPTNLTRPVAALDYNTFTSTLYWSSWGQPDTIERYAMDTEEHDVFVSFETGLIEGLAVDGIGQKLYWTDADSGRIEVINLDGTERTLLFDTFLSEPQAIKVDSTNGYLYWTDVGNEEKIERARLDDLSTRTAIVNSNLLLPVGLVLSIAEGKMYWCDAGTNLIEEADLDGSNRRQIIDLPGKYPFALEIYGNYLYWTEWNEPAGIYRVDIESGIMSIQSSDDRINYPGGIYIYKEPAGCDVECLNGGICIVKDDGTHACSCPYGVGGPTCKRLVGYCACVDVTSMLSP